VRVEVDREAIRKHLSELEQGLLERADDLALFLVFDRPQRVVDRPGLARSYFAERCASDAQLSGLIDAFRSAGAYVELFKGELPFMEALANGRLLEMRQSMKVAYNEIEGGIRDDGFKPGRKALIPTVTDAYGLICSNSHAYGCALGRHKFHYFTVLRHLGMRTPRTWHYRPLRGWAAGQRPPEGLRVIAKSTYENWSVGVTENSIFEVDDSLEERVAAVSEEIGQPATVQEFISGREVGVSVISTPDLFIPPPVETVLTKAPNDYDAVMTVHDNFTENAISLLPYEGSSKVMRALYEDSSRAFDWLELGSFARFDFRVDPEEQVWITDVGVAPGISGEDAAFLSIAELGFDHPSFLRIVLAATLATHGRLS
jgi:hypothetical protein